MRLFFDLEYMKKCNGNRDQTHLVGSFTSELLIYLENTFKVQIDFKDLLILESSNSEKASYHIIVPSVVFKSIQQCKSFVENFNKYWMEKDPSCLVNLLNGSRKTFIDTTVYCSNQNMRLIYSSKVIITLKS